MSQPPGHDASSPWEGDATSSNTDNDANSPSPPLILGETGNVSNTPQEQQQHPQPQSTLSGQVASLSGLSELQLDEGTTLNGIKISSIFVVAISILSIGIVGNPPEYGHQFHSNGVEISWADEAHTDGTFSIEHAPLERCTPAFYTNTDLWYAHTDCQGNIEVSYLASMGSFNNTVPMDQANVTILLQEAPPNGTVISAEFSFPQWLGTPSTNPQQGTTISDGTNTEFTFPINMSYRACRIDIHIWWEDQSIDSFYASELGNNCPSQDLKARFVENAGFIDFETGEGEFRLSNNTRIPTSVELANLQGIDSSGTNDEPIYMWAEYSEDYGPESFAKNLYPCFGFAMSIILGTTCLVMTFNAYREGLIKKAKGMLIGIILGPLLVASGISIYWEVFGGGYY